MNQQNLQTIDVARRGVRTLLLALIILGLMAAPGPVHAAEAPPDYVGEWGISAGAPGQLLLPLGMTVHNGQLYVADIGNARVQVFDNSLNFVRQFGSVGTGDGEFAGVYDVAVDSQGNVYVADFDNDRIQKFDASGTFLMAWAIPGLSPPALDGPRALVVDHDDYMYALASNAIFKYESDGTLVSSWTATGFDNNGLAMDEAGNLYTVGLNDRTVRKFSPTGILLNSFVRSYGSGPGELLHPTGVAVDEAGRIYILDKDNAKVQILDVDGNYVGEWGSAGAGNGQFSYALGITEANGIVFVSDSFLHRIQSFDTSGAFVDKIDRANGRFVIPTSIDVDGSGTVYVVDGADATLQRFNSEGGFVTLALATDNNGFRGASALAVAADGSYVAGISFGGTQQVRRFAQDDTFVSNISLGQSEEVTGVAMDLANSVYVTTRLGTSRVMKYASDGSQLWAIHPADVPDNFVPNGIAVAPDGTFYVSDRASQRIRRFDAGGTQIAQWGESGPGPGQFNLPTGLDVDADGNVYVTDTGSDRVQKFAPDGTFLVEWGGEGSGPGQFDDPVDIAIHGREIYVVDQNNQRVQHFRMPNTAPSADSQTIATAEDTPLAVILTGADAEGDALAFTVIGGPAHGNLSGSGASLTYTPDANFHGGDSFTFVVSDGELTSDPATVDITVNPMNDDPQMGLDQPVVSADEGQPAANSGSLTDVDDDSLSLSASVGTVQDIGNGTWAWSFTPADGPDDSQTVTISAADGQGGSASVSFDLTVNNVAPTVSASTGDPVDEGTPTAIQVDVTDPGDEDFTVQVDWGDGAVDTAGSSEASGSTLFHVWNEVWYATVIGDSVHFVSEHTYADSGEYIVTVCVQDDSSAEGCSTVSVMVKNVAPTAAASVDRTTILRGETVNVTGSWTDPAGVADEAYAWSWDLTGDGAADDSGSAAYGEVIGRSTTFSEEGDYTLTFTVSDKDGEGSSATVTVNVVNQPPVCDNAQPSVATLWPPNHQFMDVEILGVSDADGDDLTLTITGIWQDEPVNGNGDGDTGPDGQGVGTSTAQVRAERNAAKKNGGNGRVYHISFQADDGHGGLCDGAVLVGVPKSQNKPAVDDGPLYDATLAQE